MMSAMFNNARIGIGIAFILSVVSCHGGLADRFVLSDFESEADLDRVKWQCHTLFSLSEENHTHGNRSLRIELYPSAYPGMTFDLPVHNWSSYKFLSLDIYNPREEVISLAMRIDDRKKSPEFNDRYNQSFPLKPGMNHLRIPLSTLVTSGTRRVLNLKNICRCMLFMVQPGKKYILYLDYVHLL